MRILKTSNLLYLLLLCYCLPAWGDSRKSQPAVLIPIDFGERILGEIVTVKASLSNPSREVVRIKTIKTSCGCTTAKPSSLEIKPGTEVDIVIEMDSFGREGSFRGKVLVLTDSQIQPTTIITLSGIFVAKDHQLIAFPDIIMATDIGADEQVNQVIRIRRRGKVKIGNFIILPSSKSIITEVDKERTCDDTLFVDVKLLSPEIPGIIKEEIMITGDDENDFVRVPVYYSATPRLTVLPDKVLIAPNQPEYSLSVKKYDSKIGGLKKYSSVDNGISVNSCHELVKTNLNSEILVCLEISDIGFVQSILTLEFESVEPIDIIFVGYVNTSGDF